MEDVKTVEEVGCRDGNKTRRDRVKNEREGKERIRKRDRERKKDSIDL